MSIKQDITKINSRFFLTVILACFTYILFFYIFKESLNNTSATIVLNHDNMLLSTINYYRYIEWFLSAFCMLGIIPFLGMVLINRLTDKKESPRMYTITFSGWRTGIPLVLIFIVSMTIFLLILSLLFQSPLQGYPLCDSRLIRESLFYFLFYEICQFCYFVGLEFFFRGFLLMEAERIMGFNAILFSLLPYILIKMGKPAPEVFVSIIAGLILGYLTLKTRNFWYAAILHGSVAIIADTIALLTIL